MVSPDSHRNPGSFLLFCLRKLALPSANDIEIEVFLQDVPEDRRRVIRGELQALPIVDELTYISKDSAAAVFRELFGAEGTPLSDLSFLPASYRVRPVADVPADTLVRYLSVVRDIRGVDEVSFNIELLRLIDERLQNGFAGRRRTRAANSVHGYDPEYSIPSA